MMNSGSLACSFYHLDHETSGTNGLGDLLRMILFDPVLFLLSCSDFNLDAIPRLGIVLQPRRGQDF